MLFKFLLDPKELWFVLWAHGLYLSDTSLDEICDYVVWSHDHLYLVGFHYRTIIESVQNNPNNQNYILYLYFALYFIISQVFVCSLFLIKEEYHGITLLHGVTLLTYLKPLPKFLLGLSLPFQTLAQLQPHSRGTQLDRQLHERVWVNQEEQVKSFNKGVR